MKKMIHPYRFSTCFIQDVLFLAFFVKRKISVVEANKKMYKNVMVYGLTMIDYSFFQFKHVVVAVTKKNWTQFNGSTDTSNLQSQWGNPITSAFSPSFVCWKSSLISEMESI